MALNASRSLSSISTTATSVVEESVGLRCCAEGELDPKIIEELDEEVAEELIGTSKW